MSRLDKLKEQHPDLNISIIDVIAKVDPSDSYKYTEFLIKWFKEMYDDKLYLGIELIGEENGVLFNKKNITKDKPLYVRDHIFGRKNGFYLSVFPEIIRHPANCQLITHGDNIRKSFKNNDTEIELNELFTIIMNWELNYFEQSLCVDLIDKYNRGYRYNKNEYINKIKKYKYVKI